jgi:hypothetical protein
MRRRGSKVRRTLLGLLAGGAVGVLLLLALPGVASADPAVAEAPTAAVIPTTETTPVEAVPGDEAPPPAEEAPPAEETPGGPVDDGSAPPVTGDGSAPTVTDDGAAAPPAPPPSESAPVVPDTTSDGSTPVPQPVEATPSPSAGGGLPVAPDTPAVPPDKLPAAALAASTWDAPQAPVALPKGPEAQVAAAVAAIEPSAPAAVAAKKRADEAAPAPPAPELSRFSFDASGQAVQAITPPQPRPELSLAGEMPPPRSMTVELVAPTGAAGSGSSLLAVLAGYILPGAGPAPPATLMMLVILGLIVAAVYAPRPAGSERIWLSGLLGPSAGHDMAVRRPG